MKLTIIFIVALGFFLLNAATEANGSSDREDKKSIEKSEKMAFLTPSKSSRASGRRERTRNSSPAAERRRKSGEERRRQETRCERTPLKSGRETERKSGRPHSSGRPSSSRTPERKEQQRTPSGTRKKSDGRHKERVERRRSSGVRKLTGTDTGKAQKSNQRRKSQIEARGRRMSSSRGPKEDAANKSAQFDEIPRRISSSTFSPKDNHRKSDGERKSTSARKHSPSVGRTSKKTLRGRTPTRREPLKEVESSRIKTGISGENIQIRSKTPLARRSESSRQRSSSSTQQRSKSGGGKRRQSRHLSGGDRRHREHSSVSSSRRRDGGGRHKSTGRRHSSGTRRSQDRRRSDSSRRSRQSRSHSRHYSSSRIGRAKPGASMRHITSTGSKQHASSSDITSEMSKKFTHTTSSESAVITSSCEPGSLKGEASEFPRLQEGTSQTSEDRMPNSDKIRILYLAENLSYGCLKYAVTLAEILQQSGNIVDFVVAYNEQSGIWITPKGDFTVVRVPVKILSQQEENEIRKEFVFFNKHLYWLMAGMYREVAENPQVEIGSERHGILTWLRSKKYNLGIAEFGQMAGSFALFNELGIKKTIATSALPPEPSYMSIVGAQLSMKIPEYHSVRPGDGNWKWGINMEDDAQKLKFNSEQYRNMVQATRNLLQEGYLKYYKIANNSILHSYLIRDEQPPGLKAVPPLYQLLGNTEAMFINQHKLAEFPRRSATKIHYIGGIEVEESGIIRANKFYDKSAHLKWFKNSNCLIYVNFGTVVELEDRDTLGIRKMFDAFIHQSQCDYLIRIKHEMVPKNLRMPNIRTTDRFLPQQDILAQSNVKLFVTHCGQNSLNETLFAGVPVICIPFGADQPYNASIVEYLGIGVWIPRDKWADMIAEELAKLLAPSNEFEQKARNLASEIWKGTRSKNIFLTTINHSFNKSGGGSSN